MVFVVDAAAEVTDLTSNWLERAGFASRVFSEPEKCIQALGDVLPDVICLDFTVPGMGSLEALRQIKRRHRSVPVVMMTSDSSVESLLAAIELGAYECVIKPLERAKLMAVVESAVDRHRARARLARTASKTRSPDYPAIIGQSPPMQALFRDLDSIGSSDVSVLITGESGTGKELAAQALCHRSSRSDGPWVTVNCAAIPETLQESELFGHEKGSFTGAVRRHAGKFECADGGTLFLDEVAELSLPLQAKMLRALQERSFHRLGGETPISSDFRIIAATNKELAHEMEVGSFREDLFYRIAVFELRLPSLRERGSDIELLVERFIAQYAPDGEDGWRIDAAAMAVLAQHDWPGNVRELQNTIQRAVVASDDCKVIRPSDLPPRLLGRPADLTAEEGRGGAKVVHIDRPSRSRPTGYGTMMEIERDMIADAMYRNGGNVSKVGVELGLGRATVYRKLKKYQLR